MSEITLMHKSWELVKIGDMFEFTKKPRNLRINENEVIPFIPMELIPNDNREIVDWQFKKLSDISSGTFVCKNDLIISKITPCFENGKQVILNNLPYPYAYATTEVWALHAINDKATVEYLYNYLRIKEVRKSLASKMEGATGRQRLPRNILESLVIPLPPTSEQKNIVNFLTAIQDAKLKTESEMKALDELYKSALPLLMSGEFRIEDLEIPL